MRLRTGHSPEDWIDTGPGYGGSVRLGGELVIGSPGPVASQRRNQKNYLTRNQAKLDARPVVPGRPKVYATDELRDAARRRSWAASQARYRAKLRAEKAA